MFILILSSCGMWKFAVLPTLAAEVSPDDADGMFL
jgi:hypothetical protein